MRTILVTRPAPWPPRCGTQLRAWQTLSCLAERGPVDVLAVDADLRAPAPQLAASAYYAQPIDTATVRKSWWKNEHPTVRSVIRSDAMRWLTGHLREDPKRTVILQELWLAPYLEHIKSFGARVVFDAHPVEASPLGTGALKGAKQRLLERRRRQLEREITIGADVVWAPYQKEADRLAALSNRSVDVVPNGMPLDAYADIRELPQPVRGHRIVFAASFDRASNERAARRLVEMVLPRLRRLDDKAELRFVGQRPQAWMMGIANRDPLVTVTGPVDSINPHLADADIIVAPLDECTGSRWKVIEAFLAKRPVVATSHAVEGLGVTDGEHLLVRDDSSGTVAAIASLWASPERRDRLTRNAFALASEHFTHYAAEFAIERSLEPTDEMVSA